MNTKEYCMMLASNIVLFCIYWEVLRQRDDY